jgi:predicted nucleic acid-binding protein
MILDSAFLIDLFARDPDAFEKGTELADRGVAQRLPAPVLDELQYGVEFAGSEAERRGVNNLSELYPVVDVDEKVARRAGRLLGAADKRAGGVDQAGIDDIDPMIAAVADIEDEPVLTDNVAEFEALGVAVETW